MATININNTEEESKKLSNEQTYDSALTTMITRLGNYVIPLVNEAFGENYDDQALVILRNNKHVLLQLDESRPRRDSDAYIEMPGNTKSSASKFYLFECESAYDNTIFVRIAEYDSAVALENIKVIGDEIIISHPNSAIIFLHPNSSIPKKMKMTHRGPNGEEMTYHTPTMAIEDYDVETIFKKKLLILLPFYLFKFSRRFNQMEVDAGKRKELEKALTDINLRLEKLAENGGINAYQKVTTKNLILRVSQRLLLKYENTKREVENIMTGHVLRTYADDLLEQGIEQGNEEATQLINFLWKNGRGADAEKAETDKSYLKKLLEQFKTGTLTTS